MINSLNKFLIFSLFLVSAVVSAEDIELFGSLPVAESLKPKILIILDTSGSMTDTSIIRKKYDPLYTYPAAANSHAYQGVATYFVKGTLDDGVLPIPDGPNESNRFNELINGCASSISDLETKGYYVGYLREYVKNKKTWEEFPENNGLNQKPVVDCLEDIVEKKPDNVTLGSNDGYADGYPINGGTTPYTDGATPADANLQNTNFGKGEQVTLFTDNYLRWANEPLDADENSNNGNSNVEEKTKLEVAKEAIIELIDANLDVEIGLQVFNGNYGTGSDGGRVIFGINELTDGIEGTKAALTTTVNNINAYGWTPLCETLYEASLYFGGKTVWFGLNKDSRDKTIEKVGAVGDDDAGVRSYKTPFTKCLTEVNVIMITDGAPTKDTAADAEVLVLDPSATTMPIRDSKYNVDSYLAALAGWMHNHDLITGLPISDEVQNDVNKTEEDKYKTIRNANIHTVGFALGGSDDDELDVVKLLKKTAENGGGNFYEARDVSQLVIALNEALGDITATSSSFTAPAVATNSFDRTETLDSVYYSMFLPRVGPRWPGNLKKLKVTSAGVVDLYDNLALDEYGNFDEDALTFWSSGQPDGNNVEEGGVLQALRALNPANRKYLSDLEVDDGDALTVLTLTDAQSVFNGVGDNKTLAAELDVIESELANTINWAKGYDVDDEDDDSLTNDMRSDVFADPLHFKPLVINYGGSTSAQDVRIIIGTNGGVLHMFKDESRTKVTETWAYMPKEFLQNINPLRQNVADSDKVYGIDGSATIYIDDVGHDGTVDKDSDKAWVFFGLRRGGNSYYALDITDPEKPKKLWMIKGGTGDFTNLGQTWSQPVIAYSKINGEKPVLIFGGGYNTTKDISGVGTNDDSGVGIFMVDAETGTLLWKLAPESGTNTTVFAGLDSIPSKIATLDSDGDGYTDRLYTGDTGGKVWRIDMPGTDISDWTAVELASLGRHSDTGIANDRRFFNKPTVVRALISEVVTTTVITQKVDGNGLGVVDGDGNPVMNDPAEEISRFDVPYDAVLLGSGNITNPLGTNVVNKFFMIKDANVVTRTYSDSYPVPASILLSNLLNYTEDPFDGLVGDQLDEKQLELGDNLGWSLDFKKHEEGEKSMSSAIVIGGVVYFNSYKPGAAIEEGTCGISLGESALYRIDLSLGTKIYDSRRRITGLFPPGDPVIVTVQTTYNPDTDDEYTSSTIELLAPEPESICGDADCKEATLKVKTLRTFLYPAEDH